MHDVIHPKKEMDFLAQQRQLAEAVRVACIRAALAGYEDASLSGLCHEGAWERAIDAMRELKLEQIIQGVGSQE
ncbi:MAG: acetyltransferase [Anaerolineae bacterium]|nr:acetyltransferase [Anaerolineae bacterium]